MSSWLWWWWWWWSHQSNEKSVEKLRRIVKNSTWRDAFDNWNLNFLDFQLLFTALKYQNQEQPWTKIWSFVYNNKGSKIETKQNQEFTRNENLQMNGKRQALVLENDNRKLWSRGEMAAHLFCLLRGRRRRRRRQKACWMPRDCTTEEIEWRMKLKGKWVFQEKLVFRFPRGER